MDIRPTNEEICPTHLEIRPTQLQQHLVDQLQLYQSIQQQQSIYNTISSTAKPIRARLQQQKLPQLSHLQQQKSRWHFLQEAD